MKNKNKWEIGKATPGFSYFPFVFWFTLFLSQTSCSILATRPVQEMSDTAAAIRAAREVQADTLAPELYRQSTEWFFRAKNEYKLKNFKQSKDYSEKARIYAEEAEFEAIRNGGSRSENATPDPLANLSPDGAGISEPPAPPAMAPKSEPYPYPTPSGTPVESYAERKAEEAAKTAPTPTPNVSPPAPSLPKP